MENIMDIVFLLMMTILATLAKLFKTKDFIFILKKDKM